LTETTRVDRRAAEQAARFWMKARQSKTCWLWQGRTAGGYGSFKREGVWTPAHVVAYELFNGPIPAGLEPDHLCRRSYASGQTISKP